MNDRLNRRAACGALVGLGGGLLLAGRALGAEKAEGKGKPAKKPKTPLVFHNADFYTADGKFNEEAAKKAYLALCRYFGYPLNDNVRKNLYVTDFALGRFTEVGLACVVWMNEKKWNYASLEVFLLPGQVIPEHWHVAIESEGVAPKMESWTVRYGSTFAYGEGDPTPTLSVKIHEKEKPFLTVMHETALRPGDVTGVSKPMEKHWQQAGPDGCILTETSTFHTAAAVRFTNPAIKF
jgi:hypothetical protein